MLQHVKKPTLWWDYRRPWTGIKRFKTDQDDHFIVSCHWEIVSWIRFKCNNSFVKYKEWLLITGQIDKDCRKITLPLKYLLLVQNLLQVIVNHVGISQIRPEYATMVVTEEEKYIADKESDLQNTALKSGFLMGVVPT